MKNPPLSVSPVSFPPCISENTTHGFSSNSNPNPKKMVQYHSGPFPSCFRPPAITHNEHCHGLPPPPPSLTTATTTTTSSATANLTTYLYHSRLGLFSLTWSRNLFGRSLHLHFLPNHHQSSPSSSSPSTLSASSVHLNIKPLLFWNTSGSKKLTFSPDPTSPQTLKTIFLHYDFSRSKFGHGPELESGFYIAAVHNNELILLVGDLDKEAYLKTEAKFPEKPPQTLIVRREHISGNKLFGTKTQIGREEREILIECSPNSSDPRLLIMIDSKRVLQIKHLKWKFRGSERIEFDGQPIQLSWDAYNWLLEEESSDGYALFTFKFEKKAMVAAGVDDVIGGSDVDWTSGVEQRGSALSSSSTVLSHDYSDSSFGIEYERKKMQMQMKKRLLMKKRSPSTSSLSSFSSGCGSVMDWESVEENELKGPTGFSLLVYAWKSRS